MHASKHWRATLPLLAAAAALSLVAPGAALAQISLTDSEVAGRLHVGRYGYDPVAELPDLEGATTLVLGLTYWPSPSRVVGADFDVLFLNRSYASVVEGAAEPRTDVSTAGFALGGRVATPATFPVGVYGSAGMMYLTHTMEVDGLPAWFLPGVDQRWEEEGGGYTPYWGFGVEARFGQVGMSLDHRRIDQDASFDDPFAFSALPMGGSVWTVGGWFYAGPG